jgi:hypothetical protein
MHASVNHWAERRRYSRRMEDGSATQYLINIQMPNGIWRLLALLLPLANLVVGSLDSCQENQRETPND